MSWPTTSARPIAPIWMGRSRSSRRPASTIIETPMTRPFFQNEAFRKDTLARIKLGRLGQLEDLTGAIVFLASDASALMTGTSMVVDGGWTAE